jgi:site-specific recombinase XerD
MAYAFAVTEFFEWIATKYDRVVPPHKVVRKDTEDYVNWLANRPFSFAEEKLKDGDMPELEKIFSIIQEAKQINIDGIAEALPSPYRDEYFEKDGETNDAGLHLLSKTVRQLITMDLVTGTPTLEELRKKHPQAGITENTIDGVLVIRYFTYRPKKFKPASRTTVALRVAALSSFWRILMRGENALGGEAVIQYNIWDEVKERVSRGLAPMKKAASREQKVPTEVVLQMLEKAPRGSLKHLRDRAILYLMVFSGIRTTELLTLRRGNPGDKKQPYFEMREPPTLNILRKGNKWMKIPYPPVALTTLVEFQTALAKAAAPFEAQFRNRNAPNFREEYIGYYYRDLLLPEAPLFPPLHFWGNNEPQDYRKSMSRVQLFRILRSLAEESGIQEDLVQKVHPHAIRHFSANAMHLGGKDLREIQAILGHASITTTEGNLEDVDERTAGDSSGEGEGEE